MEVVITANDLEKANKSESLSSAVARPKCQIKKIIPKGAPQSYLAPPPVVREYRKKIMHFDEGRQFAERYSWEESVRALRMVQQYFGMRDDEVPSTTQITELRKVISGLPDYATIQRYLGPRDKWSEALKIYIAREQATDCSGINPE